MVCGDPDPGPDDPDYELGIIFIVRSIITELHSQKKTNIEPGLISIANGILESTPSDDLIYGFIKKSHPYWDQISSRSEEFFIEHLKDIFFELPEKHQVSFQKLFTMNLIEEEDKDILWERFKIMVKISIHHIHESRGPKLSDGKPAYSNNKFPEVKLKKMARLWDVKLNWDL